MKPLFITTLLCAITLSAAEIKPILKVDFTQGKALVTGSVKASCLLAGKAAFSKDPDAGLLLDGKTTTIKLPGTEKIHLTNGGTLYAVVRMDENGTKDGSPNAHDMVFFKGKEFLLGRSGKFLYFGNMKKNGIVHMHPNFILKKWTTIAAIIEKMKDGKYKVSLYNKGRILSSRVYPASAAALPGNAMITLGQGWGGCWQMKGAIAEIQIFDKALTPIQLRELDDAAPNLE